MQTARIQLALGGDQGNTIPKYNATPSEVAVLRTIHGEDAVTEIRITGDKDIANRDERERLVATYGGAKDEGGKVIVNELFPGAAARMFTRFDELELPEEFFYIDRKAAAQVEAVEEKPKKKRPAKTKAKAEAIEEADEDITVIEEDEDDGIEDMTANVMA